MKKLILIIVFLFVSPLFCFASFTNNGNGTITDHSTGLMWMKNTASGGMTWEAALDYCESLTFAGRSDWRLPNIKELRSIIDSGYDSPAVDIDYFPDTVSGYYWSSTTVVGYSESAWRVHFSSGEVSYYGKLPFGCYVRAVRGGP